MTLRRRSGLTAGRALAAWLVLTALGVALVAPADEGPRLVTLSEGHGPSAADAAGVALVLLGWGVLLAAIWRGRARLARRARGWPLALGVALLVGGGALVAWSVATDAGAWWVLGAALMAAVQTAAAWAGREGADAERGHELRPKP